VLSDPDLTGLAACHDLSPYDGFLPAFVYDGLASEARQLAGLGGRGGSPTQLHEEHEVGRAGGGLAALTAGGERVHRPSMPAAVS
jgi:hypothetical protein